MDGHPRKSASDAPLKKMEILLSGDGVPQAHLSGSAGRMVNAGAASNLTSPLFQEQVLKAKEHFQAEYIRFWDLFSPDFYIDIHGGGKSSQFQRLDKVFDFLVQHRLKPYVELGFKPIRLLRDPQNALRETPPNAEFYSDEEMRSFYQHFMEHLIKRYDPAEVATWYFEYWEKENLYFSDEGYVFTPMTQEEHEQYFHRFDLLAGTFRACLPDVKIGGGSFPLQHYGKDGFERLLRSWRGHSQKLGFLSLTSFPYQLTQDRAAYYEKKTADTDFVLHNIQLAKSVMASVGMGELPLHIVEYSLSLSSRNVLHDSCANSAFLLYNAIACDGKAEFLGYWLLLDAYLEYYDSHSPLFGGSGLISKYGIAKPSFYALEFYSSLFRTVSAQGANYLVTQKGTDKFRMVFHNFKRPNYVYYLAKENGIQVQDLPGMWENRTPLHCRICMRSIPNGVYRVKERWLNQENGSVQDQWKKLDMEEELSVDEISFLASSSVPCLQVKHVTVLDETLNWELDLKPQEIRYVSIEKVED